MKKSIIKKLGATALSLLPVASGVLGISICAYSFLGQIETKEAKVSLLEKYTYTQEYKENRQELEDSYFEALSSGEITREDYQKKVEEISSDSKAEDIVVKYGGQEINSKLTKLNETLESFELNNLTGFLICSVSCALLVPTFLKSSKLYYQADYDDIFENMDEESMTKPVII